jgi:hypothetical protein
MLKSRKSKAALYRLISVHSKTRFPDGHELLLAGPKLFLKANFLAGCGGNGAELKQWGLAQMFHELLSRDHKDGLATGQPSRGTAGLVPRCT